MPFIAVTAKELSPPAEGIAEAFSLVGALLWIVVYVVTIRSGYNAATYGIPALAICLNICWEAIFVALYPSRSKVVRIIYLCWLSLDCIILYQLYRYGIAEQTVPEIQRYFFAAVTCTLLLAFLFHYTFHKFANDSDGAAAAYIINLVMSILFVFVLFARRDQHGLSHCAAWLKMLGTALMSIANIIYMLVGARQLSFFMVFLFCATFLFDVIYLLLMYAS